MAECFARGAWDGGGERQVEWRGRIWIGPSGRRLSRRALPVRLWVGRRGWNRWIPGKRPLNGAACKGRAGGQWAETRCVVLVRLRTWLGFPQATSFGSAGVAIARLLGRSASELAVSGADPCQREGGRVRDRQTLADRQTGRQTDRQTDRVSRQLAGGVLQATRGGRGEPTTG